MLKKVAYAGARSASFVGATQDLEALAETKVSRERVQRWTKRLGNERVSEVEEQAEQYQALPLPEQRKSPTDQVPQVACVMADGGRIQIRERQAKPQEKESKGHWRESLVGCCLSMTSEEHSEDPCPTIPQTFVDSERMGDLSREIKGFCGRQETAEESPDQSPDDRAGRPDTLVKSVVATRVEARRRSTNSLCEIGSAQAAGTRTANRQSYRPRWWREPAANISRLASGSPGQRFLGSRSIPESRSSKVVIWEL